MNLNRKATALPGGTASAHGDPAKAKSAGAIVKEQTAGGIVDGHYQSGMIEATKGVAK